MKRKKSSLRVKIIIGIVSFLFAVISLELILRASGYFILSKYEPKKVKNSAGNYVILCIGDSFTFGGNVSREESYPWHLAKILETDNPGKTYVVINKGMCEINSRQLLKSLPKWIQKYHPDLIISLIGSANKFNLLNYNLYSDGKENILLILKDTLYGLKVFKMTKLIILNLKWKTLYYFNIKYLDDIRTVWNRYSQARNYFEKMEKTVSFTDDDPVPRARSYYNKGNVSEALGVCQEYLRRGARDPEILCATAYFHYKKGNYQLAEQLFKEAFKKSPHSEITRCKLIFFYRKLAGEYVKEGRFDLAVEYYLKDIELEPREFPPYYLMSKAFELQSRYDCNLIIRSLQKMLKADPRLEKDRLFMSYFTLFRNKQIFEIKINDWLKDELEQIVNLAQKNKIGLIIQNYPVSYPMANNALKETADKYSLPFVDNLVAFNRLGDKSGKGNYISDDDHCTSQGYRIIAENVYKILVSEGIAPKPKEFFLMGIKYFENSRGLR